MYSEILLLHSVWNVIRITDWLPKQHFFFVLEWEHWLKTGHSLLLKTWVFFLNLVTAFIMKSGRCHGLILQAEFSYSREGVPFCLKIGIVKVDNCCIIYWNSRECVLYLQFSNVLFFLPSFACGCRRRYVSYFQFCLQDIK